MIDDLLRSIVAKFEESNQMASDSLQQILNRQNRGLAGLPVNWDDDETSRDESDSLPDSDTHGETPAT
jgi:hypothetical protein